MTNRISQPHMASIARLFLPPNHTSKFMKTYLHQHQLCLQHQPGPLPSHDLVLNNTVKLLTGIRITEPASGIAAPARPPKSAFLPAAEPGDQHRPKAVSGTQFSAMQNKLEDHDPCKTLILSYHGLNPASVDELNEVPSALDFMRYVAKNRPFVIRNGASDWEAVKKWDAQYLRDAMKGQKVRVAVTPKGNADAIVENEQGRLLFAEPHEIHEPFEDFLQYIQDDANPGRGHRNVKYAQPQNDSLREEYPALFDDVPDNIDFATEALATEPDAINFWLGNERSVTSLHKDNYENIYVQVRGKKLFTLLPPVEMPCVNETPISFTRYQPVAEDETQLVIGGIQDSDPVPVPIWDPDEPEARSTEYSQNSSPLKVELREGDMMYLPAMWYHKVGQINGPEDFVCSVNYWYDMDFSGSFWTNNAYIRETYNASTKKVAYPDLNLSNDA